MDLLLGIDLGTSYFKVGLFDVAGGLIGLGRVRVPKRSPRPGYSELDVDEFWAALRQGLAEALAGANARPEQIVGMSYSSQASTFLLLDAAGRPLTPLIMWIDERGAPLDRRDVEFAERDEFARTVGHKGLSAQSAVAKWRWFQRVRADVWRRAAHVLTISDYFTWALTGEKVGDASSAAFLGLYDLTRGGWWPDALEFYGIESGRLARPFLPGTKAGRTMSPCQELLNVPVGVPFAVGALDHHAAAIGSGLGRFADVSISTGTVLAALRLVDRAEPVEDCFHGPHADGRRYWRLSFDPAGAGQLEQYRERHAPESSIEQLLEDAAHPTLARHGGPVRDILKRISQAQRNLVSRIADTSTVAAVLATGGGARSAVWLQITSDALGVPVVTVTASERACLGAAAFAAAVSGAYPDWSKAAERMVNRDHTYESAALAWPRTIGRNGRRG